MKPNNITKIKKANLGLAIAVFSLLCLISSTAVAKADTSESTSVDTTKFGYWTGKDGDCDWTYSVVTKTLVINASPKANQLSNIPLKKEFKWYASIEHIVFETPVKLAADSSEKFAYLTNLQDIKGLDKVDTSETVNMSKLFKNDSSLTSIDLNNFDTSNVTNMSQMFERSAAPSLDVSKFNTANVTDMSNMFSMLKNVTSLDLSNFDTSKVTNMDYMFNGSSALTQLNLNGWNTKNVKKMNNMFYYLYNITSLDLSSFNTGKVTDMAFMFGYCKKLSKLNISNFNTKNVTSFAYMFVDNKSIKSLDLHHFKTSKAKDMLGIFSGDTSLEKVNLKGWNTKRVTRMSSMFENCPNLVKVDLRGWHTPKLKETYKMFAGDKKLAGVDLSHFNMQNKGILIQTGNPKGFAVKLGHYRLQKNSGVGQGFKHIQAVGSGTLYNPKGKKYTEKQLLKLYSHSAKRSPMEIYVMYNGKRPQLPKGLKIK